MTADTEKKAPVADAHPHDQDESANESERTNEVAPRDEVEELREQLAVKTAEAAESYDRYLRERAELENFKRRVQRDKAEALRFASEALVRDLIPVIDNLERAVEHAESGGDGRPLIEGVRLVLKNALDVLERHGVKRMEAGGEAFDPARHEAVAQVPHAEMEPNRVVQQFLPGYCLHDRLLRPAQVSVSTKPAVEKAGEDD
jgi:molecular chaperone GrpE